MPRLLLLALEGNVTREGEQFWLAYGQLLHRRLCLSEKLLLILALIISRHLLSEEMLLLS